MIKRVMALTSSMLFAAGSTPWPTAGGYHLFHSKPLKEQNTDSAQDVQVEQDKSKLSYTSVVDVLRDRRRLGEIHYAVAQSTVVPLVQTDMAESFTLRQKLREKTRQQAPTNQRVKQRVTREQSLLHQATPTRIAHRGANGGIGASLSSRGGVAFGTAATTDNFGVKVASLALSYVGSPYRYGGTSTSGFDCSGFAQYVFAKMGVALPRTTYEQCLVGSDVSWSELQPGDLLFFTTNQRGPSHVAIYIGNGLIVQALNHSTGVIVSKLGDKYYSSRFVGAKRITFH